MKLFSSVRPLFFLAAMALAATTSRVQAASSIKLAGSNYPNTGVLVYKRALNPTIGITAGNANGSSYTVTDENGKVVMAGSIRSDKTFYIATSKLGSGLYCFRIGGQVMQQFIIR